MDDIKTLKIGLKKKTDKSPEKYYAVEVLKSEGYIRKKCEKCDLFFWTASDDNVCGEPECEGGYKFIGNPPTKAKMSFLDIWKSFSNFFEKAGYKPIKRYPTAARWRDDTDFVQASIYNFQPFVVSGEVEPPANPLVVPQYCARFNYIDSVGLSGRHNTGFVMIGQHGFYPPKKFDQEKYFRDLYDWFIKEVKIPKQEMKFHESQWGGGGNLGVCMEIFSRGLELANQVYMMYEITPKGYKDLKLKVLDMGMGQDRPAWLTLGSHTIYEVDYPDLCKKLYKKTGLDPSDIFHDFVPYGSILDVDSDIQIKKAWQDISKKMNMEVEKLQKEILPLAALYSIADHSQTLLLTISDGVLPSNISGGYNLRVILRRALGFIDEYGWDISLPELVEWHAKYLKPMYPELVDSVKEVNEILEFEEKKYEKTLKRIKHKIANIIEKQKKFDVSTLTKLYESDGITPELIKEIARKEKKEVEIPPDFYSKMSKKFEKKKKEIKKPLFDVSGLSETEVLYYMNKMDFKARVLKVFEKGEDYWVVLDKTGFYPESGGQAHDQGILGDSKVLEVMKIGNVIVHRVDKKLKKNEVLQAKVDEERRKQLKQHHTATHIINGAARRVLGNHVWQTGAEKTVEKARLDISHYDILSQEKIDKIQKLANKVIQEKRKIIIKEMPRNEAEKKYGFRLYQGGAVPSKILRVVDIVGWDVEACGGIHTVNTSEVEIIKITSSKKKQDGVVRLEFVAGKDLVEKTLRKTKVKKKKRKEDYERKIKEKIKIKDVVKTAKISEIPKENVVLKSTEDMRELQTIGRIAVKQDPTRSIVLVGRGIIFGIRGEKSKTDVKKVVEEGTKIMGGKAGGRGNEFKGGGPKKDKTKEAYEKVRKMLK